MTSTASRPIIDTDLVLLDVDAGADKQAVIGRLVGSLADAGRTTDADGLIAAAMAREEQSATGLPGGIAIPHCRSPHVETASIGFARLAPPVDFGAPDGPADLAFLIAAPEGGGAEHMKLLSSLARALVRKDFVQSLRDAKTADEVVGLVDEVLNPSVDAEACRACREARSRQTEDIGGDHRLSDRHCAHLHGRRLARRRGEGSRCHAACRDAGLVGQHAAGPVDDRRGGRRHLRHRRRCEGQGTVRGQAGRRVRCQAGDQRAGQDGRRSARRRGQSERRPCRGLRRRCAGEQCTRRRCRLGHPHPADPAHRRELHDSVRRRRWSADRTRLPVRRLRDREQARRRNRELRAHVCAEQFAMEPATGRILAISRRGAVQPRRPRLRLPGACARRLHRLRHRRPSRNRTRASPLARSPCSSVPDSSAASSAA